MGKLPLPGTISGHRVTPRVRNPPASALFEDVDHELLYGPAYDGIEEDPECSER
jgi:hypothetical protein